MKRADSTEPAGIHIGPERLQELLNTWNDAPPRTDDENFRLLDGTPVTEEEYFALVDRHRSRHRDRA